MRPIEEFRWDWLEDQKDKNPEKVAIDVNCDPVAFDEWYRKGTIKEIFEERIYEKIFEVEGGDIVVDIGSSIGPFIFSILHKNPKHVYAIEPSESEFKTLVLNTIGYPVTPILKGISDQNSVVDSDTLFGDETSMEGITFQKLIYLYNLDRIDFLKIDCEGGEYLVFNEENLEFLKTNVRKIAGEWHLSTVELKEKFKNFRDTILIHFDRYEVFSVDGVDIKWSLFNDEFIDYYTEVIIYIDNRTNE